jgi:hypothetical protein
MFGSPQVLTTNKLNFNQSSNTLALEHVDKKMDVFFWNDLLGSQKMRQALQANQVILNEVDIAKVGASVSETIYKGYFLALVPPSKQTKFKCAFDLTNKVVGFFDRCDYHLIQSIIYSYRISRDAVSTVELPYESLANISKWISESDIDIFITYVVPGSAYHNVIGSIELLLLSWETVDLDRLGLFYPKLRKSDILVEEVVKPSHKTTVVRGTTTFTLLETNHYRVPLGSAPETFISRLQYSPDALDTSYGCFGDLLIESKANCNSNYTPTGELKPSKTVWDKRCTRNEECPFFSKHSMSERGGCKDGFCELPIGVQRTSFMKYNANGAYKPFCYGCDLNNITTCCEKQKEPQYAFADSNGVIAAI